MTKRSITLLTYITTALLLCVCGSVTTLAAPIPYKLPPKEDLYKIRSAVIKTEKGDMRFELFPEDAPWHVANFKYLADRGFYRNKTFHILIPGYIVQGGSPNPRNPKAGPGWNLPPEFSRRHHGEGSLGMARLPDAANYARDSNGSQFHILLGNARHMDGIYTIFGQITNGKQVLHSLERGDVIKDIIVYVGKSTP